MQAFMEGIPPALVTFLEIHVRRDHIVMDTLNQIRLRPNDLKKPLRVTFISNDVSEEGQDAGGLSKEFFQLLVSPLPSCFLAAIVKYCLFTAASI